MNCVDEHVMKQIYVEVDKATKHLYNDEQLEQIIANVVESRVKQHIINRAHELLMIRINDRIAKIAKQVIKEHKIDFIIRRKMVIYFHSEEFAEKINNIINYSDLDHLGKDITLGELQDYINEYR